MQRIADWLKKLGMSEYAERFAENDIEIDILPELTDHDLERLGISLGHRRRILRAIRELGGSPQAGPQTAAASPAPHDSAERRQLTVMFCDLVGSTALSVKLDLEDLRAIIADYHRYCTELVECNGGFVARYMGDGVLAYFGYPQAHEHDAERAVRAGLALVEAVQKLRAVPGVPLQVLHTEFASVVKPIVDFIDELRKRHKHIVVLVPVVVPERLRYLFLHNHLDKVISSALRGRPDIVVAKVPTRVTSASS